MGRPTELTPELLEKANGYLNTCVDFLDPDTQEREVNLPSIAGLARHLNISRKTLYNWVTKSEEGGVFAEFLHIYEDILAEQEKRLVNNGLSGKYGPTISKLILTKHGYTDKADVTSDGEKVSVAIINFQGADGGGQGDADNTPAQSQ